MTRIEKVRSPKPSNQPTTSGERPAWKPKGGASSVSGTMMYCRTRALSSRCCRQNWHRAAGSPLTRRASTRRPLPLRGRGEGYARSCPHHLHHHSLGPRATPIVRGLATEDTMHRLALGLFCAASLAAQAMAQDRILHVGLREYPDLLDPTLGSSYVGRIVFSGICDNCSTSMPSSTSSRRWRPATNGRTPRTSSSTSVTACYFRTGKTRRRSREVQADARPERQRQHAARRGQLDLQHRCA